MGDGFHEFVERHPGHDLVVEGGARLHFLDEGSGEPVVMLHGNPSWSYYYRRLVEELSGSGYRTIVPDHVGCGRSEKPGDDRYEYRLERRVADLETLLDALGLRNGLTLVLHDWGGAIGSVFAARHPERIARLVILNTAGFHKPPSKSLVWPIWLCRNPILGAGLVRGLNAFCLGTAAIGCKRTRMPREVRSAYLAPYDSWRHRIAIHRFVQDIPLRPGDPSHDLLTWTQDRLSGLADVPMLIAWGMLDFVFDADFLAEWIRRFPAAEVHRIADAGHYVLEDAPDVVLPLVREFLAARPLARALA